MKEVVKEIEFHNNIQMRQHGTGSGATLIHTEAMIGAYENSLKIIFKLIPETKEEK